MSYRKTLVDNIFKDSAFLSYLRMTDSVKRQNGGERIAMPLIYGDNTTIGTHSGYEVIDTTPQDGISTAFYEWAEIAGTISISRKEERQNSGEGRLINLLQAKIQQAEMTMREYMNDSLLHGDIYGTAPAATFVPYQSRGGTDGLNPLGYFFRKLNQTDPARGGNVGNISGSSYSWWRHNTAVMDGSADTGNVFSATISTWAGTKYNFYKMYNWCSRGSGGKPDLVVTDQTTYEYYNMALDASVRYQNTRMADMGFDTIKLRGATVLWDEMVPDLDNGYAIGHASWDGTAFFINTRFYNLIIDSETDIITTPFVSPENQTAKTAKILFMGNAGVSNMRKHGVVYAIARNVTS